MGKVCWPGDPGRPPPPNQGPSPAPSSTAGSEAHLLAWAPAPKARQATRAAPFCFPLFISPFHLPSTIHPPPPILLPLSSISGNFWEFLLCSSTLGILWQFEDLSLKSAMPCPAPSAPATRKLLMTRPLGLSHTACPGGNVHCVCRGVGRLGRGNSTGLGS